MALVWWYGNGYRATMVIIIIIVIYLLKYSTCEEQVGILANADTKDFQPSKDANNEYNKPDAVSWVKFVNFEQEILIYPLFVLFINHDVVFSKCWVRNDINVMSDFIEEHSIRILVVSGSFDVLLIPCLCQSW